MENSNYPLDWQQIYSFYYQHGLTVFIINNITKIAVSFLITFAPVFIFGCINYGQIKEGETLTAVIRPFGQGFKASPIFIKIAFIIYLIVDALKIKNFLKELKGFLEVHKFYKEKLKINDSEVSNLKWQSIFDAIVMTDDLAEASLTRTAQDITRYDNYISGLIRDQRIFSMAEGSQEIPIDKLFISCLKFSFNKLVFTSNGSQLLTNVDGPEIQVRTAKLVKRFRFIGVVLLILSPFYVFYKAIEKAFNYLQMIRSTPTEMKTVSISERAKYAARYYDELPADVDERVRKSYEWASLFIAASPKPALEPLMQTVTVLCGFVIATVTIVGLMGDVAGVLSLRISNTKTVAWLLTVAAVIYSLCAPENIPVTNIHGLSADELFEKLVQVMGFDVPGGGAAALKFVRRAYPAVWQSTIMEIFSMPIDALLFLVFLPRRASAIISFFVRQTVTADGQYVCSPNMFRQNYGSAQFGMRPQEQEEDIIGSLFETQVDNNDQIEGDEDLIGF